jgi:hypothetical protein
MHKLLKNIWDSICRFFGKLPEQSKHALHWATVIVSGIKDFDSSVPLVGDIVTSLIPGNADDKLLLKVRQFLPKILLELKLVDCALNETDPDKIILSAIKALQQMNFDWISDAARKNFYDSVAVMLAQCLSDGKLGWDDAKYIVKWYYDHKSVN